MKAVFTSNAPAPIGPYSQAILKNGFLFVSGQIALDAETGQINSGNIQDETKAVMSNLEAILTEAQYAWTDVIKCTIFIRDMGQFVEINEIYGQYFTEIPPARETVEVSRLPKDVNVEISLVAAK